MPHESNNFQEFKNNLILIGVAAVTVGLAAFLTVAYILTESEEDYDFRPDKLELSKELPDPINSKDTVDAKNTLLFKP